MSFLKRKSRGSFQVVCSEQRVPAYYLGKHPAKGKVGLTVIEGPVAALTNQFRDTMGKRVLLEVRNEGLWVKHTNENTGGRIVRRHTVDKGINLANRSNSSFTISSDDISFGAVDSTQRKVFAIIVRKSDPEIDSQWECHAFLCNTHADAKQLTLNLVASFQRLAQAKGIGVGGSSPNTMHVFTESVTPKYQRGDAAISNVTTLKITFNVEQIDTSWSENSEYNRNKDISKILAQETSKFNDNSEPTDVKENGSAPISGSSDKENEGSDSDILDVEPKTRTSLVAVNTGLTELTRVQEDGSDEDTQMGTTNEEAQQVSSTIQESSSPKQARTKPKPRKKKTVRFTAEINYID